MKTVQAVLLFCLIMLPLGSATSNTDVPRFLYAAMDVSDYRSLTAEQRVAYVSGLLDGVFVAAWLQLGPVGERSTTELNAVVNCITTLQHYHVADIIADYLSEKDVSESQMMHTVARNALSIDRILEENPGAVAGGCDIAESET